MRKHDGLSAPDVSICLGVSTLAMTAASAEIVCVMVRYAWICLCISRFNVLSIVDKVFKPKFVVTGLSWTVCELWYLISIYRHFEFWAFPSCMERWSKIYSIILIAIFSGRGLFIYCTFLEVKYWRPDSVLWYPATTENASCLLTIISYSQRMC